MKDLDERATVYRFNVPFPLGGILSFFSYVLTIARAPASIVGLALRRKADVIHVQEIPFSMAALAAGTMLRLPVVLEIREPYPAAVRVDLQPLFSGSMGRLILELIAKVSDFVQVLVCLLVRAVICISDEEKSRLVRLGISKQKITVIMDMPEIREFHEKGGQMSLTNSKPTVVYAGFLLPWKGVDVLLKAFSYLVNEVPEARLVLIGDGPSRRGLEAKARELSLSDKVAFLGNVHPAKALDLVRESHVAVVPHLVSSMPSKMFFYMHCGRPIVSSDFPGVRRVLNETGCGILFRAGDTRSLADALRRVLLDDALRYQLSSNAEKAAEQRYNWENESQKLIDLYSSL